MTYSDTKPLIAFDPFALNTIESGSSQEDYFNSAFGSNQKQYWMNESDGVATNCCFPKQLISPRRNRRVERRARSKSRQGRSRSWGRRTRVDQKSDPSENTEPWFDEFTTADTFDNEEVDDVPMELLFRQRNGVAALTTTLPVLEDTSKAVQTLSFDDYPETAELRAAQILNHWILDHGLYDDITNINAIATLSSVDSFSVQSVMSQEGIEVGAHGFPMEGLERLDLEIDILRERMRRELSLVNAQLDDHPLLQDGDDESTVSKSKAAMDLQGLEGFPRIQALISSRQHIVNVFDQVETFCEIPTICDRLYRELSDDPMILRDLCQQHNDLQIMLVKIEKDLKDRMDEVEAAVICGITTCNQQTLHSHCYIPSYPNHGGVDQFLLQPVKLVWDLGLRLRNRLVESIKIIHLLRQDKISALVESVELYEKASEECSRFVPIPGTKKRSRLYVPPIRQLALGVLVESFESRCYLVVQALQEQAANDAHSQDVEQLQFNAIHQAATTLMEQIDFFQSNVEPNVPPCWHVTNLWIICVATVCSQFFLQQIGGQEGNNLEAMSVTQLLQLLSWIEHFRKKAEAAFPDMIRDHIVKTRFVSVTELLTGKEINDDSTKVGLVSVLHVLWDIHRLAQDQLMVRTQFQTHEWLENVYKADHQKAQISGGTLITSLPEDVWGLASVQVETIGEMLPEDSCVLVDATTIIFHQMQFKQRRTRDLFLVDLETCCAAANDLLRMSERAEQTLVKFQKSSAMSNESILMLEAVTEELIRQYSNDAVYSAQSVHVFIFEALENELAGKLFEFEWEDKTHNEMAMTIIRTIEDFLQDIAQWMDDVMVRKSIDAMVKGCVNFYIRHLMLKAAKRGVQVRSSCFQNNERALRRMAGDIKIMRDFFERLVEKFPPLARIIENEFDVLENVFGLLAVATELDEAAPEDFLPVIQRHVRNVAFTRYLSAGLWKLVNPTNEGYIHEVIDKNIEELMAFEDKQTQISQEYVDPTLQLSFVLQGVLDERKQGPLQAKLKARAVEKMKKMKDVMKNLRQRGDKSDVSHEV